MVLSAQNATPSASVENELDSNIEAFENFLRSIPQSGTTIINYTSRLKQVVRIIGKDPTRWSESDCDDLLVSDIWSTWSNGTRILTKAALKSYWQYFRCRDLLENITFWKSGRKKGGLSKFEALKKKTATPEDVRRVKENCIETILHSESPIEVYRHYPVYLMAQFGIRLKATVHLRVCDFHLDEGYIHIHKTKGDKSRNIDTSKYCDDPLAELHSAFLSARSSILSMLLERFKDVPDTVTRLKDLEERADAYLFFNRVETPRSTGDGIGMKSMENAIYSITKYVTIGALKPTKGLPPRSINPHAFRHAKCFELLEIIGLEPYQAMVYMGHETIQITLDYVPFGLEEQRNAFNKAEVKNGNGGTSVTTSVPSSLEAKIAILKELHDAGALDSVAFGIAVAALMK